MTLCPPHISTNLVSFITVLFRFHVFVLVVYVTTLEKHCNLFYLRQRKTYTYIYILHIHTCNIPTKKKVKADSSHSEKQLICLQKEERNLLFLISQYSLAPYVSFGFFFYFCFSSLLKDYSKLYYAWIQKLQVSQKSQISQDRHVHLSFHSRRTIAASI